MVLDGHSDQGLFRLQEWSSKENPDLQALHQRSRPRPDVGLYEDRRACRDTFQVAISGSRLVVEWIDGMMAPSKSAA